MRTDSSLRDNFSVAKLKSQKGRYRGNTAHLEVLGGSDNEPLLENKPVIQPNTLAVVDSTEHSSQNPTPMVNNAQRLRI